MFAHYVRERSRQNGSTHRIAQRSALIYWRSPLGRVTSAAELPANAQIGDRWIAKDSGRGWYWSGYEWVDCGPVEIAQWDVSGLVSVS
jgi:hypothetical protein